MEDPPAAGIALEVAKTGISLDRCVYFISQQLKADAFVLIWGHKTKLNYRQECFKLKLIFFSGDLNAF